MKINKISWRNYRNLLDGEICAEGRNVEISGRNGAGKSSLASVLPFVLFGRISCKAFDEHGLTVANQVPEGEIVFDSGLKLRRVITADNKNHTYVNGREVSAGKFSIEVHNLTGGAGMLLFNPFEFPNQPWKVQRDFLLENFATTEELPSEDEIRGRGKSINSELVNLDGRIQEIYAQLNKTPDISYKEANDEFAALQIKLSAAKAARQKLDGNVRLLENAIADTRRQISALIERRNTAQFNRRELLEKYRNVKTVCPTCGAKIPADRVEAARADIVATGRKVRDEIEKFNSKITELSDKLDKMRLELDQAELAADDGSDAVIATMERELERLREVKVRVNLRRELEDRLREFTDRRKSLVEQLQMLKGELTTVSERRQQLIRKKEADVNSQFEFVTFKLFKVLVTTGEIRETCEPMIDGVPFANLSTGEKFKAACDILRALQLKFNREMPLMIDNAESYTSNSLVELSNQLFTFKVTDTDLKVEVHDD